jgi:hypothetical protein
VTPLEVGGRECFYRRMQALSDDQRIGRLEGKVDGLDEKLVRLEGRVDRFETKMDNGFAEVRGEFATVRSEHRSDYRTLLGIQLTTFLAMILGFAGLLLQHHL